MFGRPVRISTAPVRAPCSCESASQSPSGCRSLRRGYACSALLAHTSPESNSLRRTAQTSQIREPRGTDSVVLPNPTSTSSTTSRSTRSNNTTSYTPRTTTSDPAPRASTSSVPSTTRTLPRSAAVTTRLADPSGHDVTDGGDRAFSCVVADSSEERDLGHSADSGAQIRVHAPRSEHIRSALATRRHGWQNPVIPAFSASARSVLTSRGSLVRVQYRP